jgi:O-antigen/teichoic acid export membrane protein
MIPSERTILEAKVVSDRHQGFRTRFAANVAITLVGQVGIIGLGTFTGVMAARLLGPQGRGELAALTLWPSLLVFLSGMGINQSVAFHMGQRRYGPNELCTASTVFGLAVSLCVFLVGLVVVPLALTQYSPNIRSLALVFLAASPLIWLGGVPSSIMQGRVDMVSFVMLRAAAPFAYATGLGLLFWLNRPYLRDVVACQILGFALALGLGTWLLFARMRIKFTWENSASVSLLKFGLKTHLGDLSSYLNRSADQLVLSLFVAPRELGLYTVAVTMASVLGLFPEAVGLVTFATGANSSSQDARKLVADSFRACLVWLLVLSSVMFFAAPVLITLLFGSAFAESALACRILLPGMVALGLNRVLFDSARALNEPSLPSYAEGFATLVTFTCLYLLLPRFGFVGAAIASTLAYAASLVFMLALCRFRLRIGIHEILGLTTEPAVEEHLRV